MTSTIRSSGHVALFHSKSESTPKFDHSIYPTVRKDSKDPQIYVPHYFTIENWSRFNDKAYLMISDKKLSIVGETL
jgi:hypothetical protein